MYDQNLRNRMAAMSPRDLQQFATMHKNDPFVVSMALDIDNTRKAAQRQQAMQAVQQPQPKVVDQDLAMIGQPEVPPQAMQAGLPQIPAQNIATMADGGIAGYAEGKEVKGDRESYRAYAMKKAQEMGLDPTFVDGIFGIESGYDPKAKSKTGPQGIGQLTEYIAKKFGISSKDRLDPYKNIDASMGFMDYLNKKYKGDKAKMAVAYNQGEPVLDAHLKQNKGQLVPEKLHENVKTANKAEPANYLKRMTDAGALAPTQTAETGTREAPRTPEMLARQKQAIRNRDLLASLPIASAQAAEPPVGKPTGAQQIAAIEQKVPVEEIMRREQAEAAARKKEEAGKLPKPVREALGAPEAVASFLSGAVAPATALLPFGLSQFTDKPLTYEQAMDAATFAPRTEVGKESLGGLYQAVDDYKIPPYIPGIGAPRRAPAKGQAARAAALATEAELAALKERQTRTRIPPNISEIKPEPNFAADVAAAARARVPKTPLMQEIEQARALEKGRQEFSVAPETAALGDEALARRRAVEQAQAELKAKAANERVPGLAETPAEKLTPEQALEADKARTAELEQKLVGDQARASELGFEDLRAREDMAAKAEINRRLNAGRNLAGGAAGAATRGPGEVAPDEYTAYSDEPGYNFRDKVGEEKTGGAPVEERGRTAAPETSQRFPLSDEDWLMMGLNMLQAPAGQTGGALSQLAQNIGRSGLATLGARKTREQQALDNLYKQAHGEYFKQMGQEAAAKAEYYRDAKSEDARRLKVLDAVSEGMKSWNQANFGATPQEEQAQRARLFDYYSQQLGLTPLASGASKSSNLFRVLD